MNPNISESVTISESVAILMTAGSFPNESVTISESATILMTAGSFPTEMGKLLGII